MIVDKVRVESQTATARPAASRRRSKRAHGDASATRETRAHDASFEPSATDRRPRESPKTARRDAFVKRIAGDIVRARELDAR